MAGAELGQKPVLTLYEVLGVSIKATAEDIRMSYRRLARLWHPDRHFGDDSAKRKFQQIQCAYEVLSNAKRRQHYDLGFLEQLDVEDYLNRFQDFILTANGLGMSLSLSLSQEAEAEAAAAEVGAAAPPCQQMPNSSWRAVTAA